MHYVNFLFFYFFFFQVLLLEKILISSILIDRPENKMILKIGLIILLHINV